MLAVKLCALLVLACLLSAAQTQDPASDPLQKGYDALRSGDDREAAAWFEEAARLAPESAAVRKELGYVYLRLGDHRQSQQAFEDAARLDPDNMHTALELAFAYHRAGDLEQSRSWFGIVRERGDAAQQETAQHALENLSRGQGGPDSHSDPVLGLVDSAYAALRTKDYDTAIRFFQQAVAQAPERSSIRKDLGYVYLKIGETEWAREMFAQALRLQPDDHRAALELAYLHHETGAETEAIRLLRTLQKATEPETRAEARAALDRIESELSQSIARWNEAVEMDPGNLSAQLELAALYDKRGDSEKAAGHYLAAWDIPSDIPHDEILPRLARARAASGDQEGATGAWLLASRSQETRIAEAARPHLPERYPYASEFRQALEINPRHFGLRQDLAYLQLEVGNDEEARKEFEILVEQNPKDLLAAAQLAFLYLERNQASEAAGLLERARRSPDEDLAGRAEQALRQTREAQAQPHRDRGVQSLEKHYLEDARRSFLRAYEIDPNDFDAALKIGILSNLMHDDRDAMRWFRTASASPDPEIAAQGRQFHANLAPQFRRFTTTLWTFPFFSTRYHDVFQYSQLKTEIRVADLPIRPYFSLRFVGDLKQHIADAPQFLSESSLIAAAGLRVAGPRGLTLWAEAGEALSYLGNRPPGVPRAGPDYRGGLNWFLSKGASLGGSRSGTFGEMSFDGVYVSRFDNDWITYSQFRTGYRLPGQRMLRSQLYWNLNLTADRNRTYWANYVEFGPGLRVRIAGRSRPLDLSVNFLRGVHLINEGNPRRPNYYDLRIGLWYSLAM